MKFRVERDVLADAVAWAARSLPSRPPVPVLAGLLLDASDGRLVLSSFDYEVSGRVEIAADIAEPGVALVSGRLLADISRSLPARPVEITTDAAKVVVTCGSARFSLLTLPVEDYPALPDMPSASGSLRGDSFAAAVAQVSIAAGRDDTLPVLTGVRLEIDGEKITMAATDRYRLAVRDLAGRRSSPACRRSHWSRHAPWPTPRSPWSAPTRSPSHWRRAPGPRAWSASRGQAGARRRACSTASSRSTARCSRTSRRSAPPLRPPP